VNKGLKLLFCKECNRKRFCSRIPIPGYYFKWTCSKKHSWIVIGMTLERVNAAIQDAFDVNKMKNLFDRDDIFWRRLKK
jgi:hypothetical protein